MTSETLIFTNGRATTCHAIEYGAWLAVSLRTSVRLVGIDEDPSPSQIDEETHPLEGIFAGAVETFKKAGLVYQLEVRKGHAEDVIPRCTQGQDSLVVVGPLGRPPLKRLWSGRSFRYIMEQIAAPIVYVPQMRLPLKRMLVCMGGLGYEVTAENIAMQVAQAARADVTLLTVRRRCTTAAGEVDE